MHVPVRAQFYIFPSRASQRRLGRLGVNSQSSKEKLQIGGHRFQEIRLNLLFAIAVQAPASITPCAFLGRPSGKTLGWLPAYKNEPFVKEHTTTSHY